MSDNNPQELDLTPEPKTARMGEIGMSDMGIQLRTFADAWTLATAICRAGMAPKLGRDGFMSPGQVLVAIQMGLEVHLPPMTALKNISIIGGRPVIWGDALLSLAFRRNLIESIEERIEGEGDERTASCHVKRKGMVNVVTRTFSVLDAKKAGLWGKAGPWQSYPDRMLAMRARGFALRDTVPDALGGFTLAEEAQDMQVTEEVEESRTEALLANLSEAKADEAKPLQTETLFPVEMSGDRDE